MVLNREGGGWGVYYLVNFQCWDALTIGIIVGQEPIAFAVGAGRYFSYTLSPVYHFSLLSLSLSLSGRGHYIDRSTLS